MSERPDDLEELLAGASKRDRAELEKLIHRLEDEAPQPAPGFRSKLRHTIEIKLQGRRRRREAPARIGALVAAYAGSGLLLLAVAAIGLAGAGPFAA